MKQLHQRKEVVFMAALILILFWAATYMFDLYYRRQQVEQFMTFMNRGDRFTHEDGRVIAEYAYDLCIRIRHLESQHHNELGIQPCFRPFDEIDDDATTDSRSAD